MNNYYTSCLCSCCKSERHISIPAESESKAVKDYIEEALHGACPHCSTINNIESELTGMGVSLTQYFRNIYMESLIADKLQLLLDRSQGKCKQRKIWIEDNNTQLNEVITKQDKTELLLYMEEFARKLRVERFANLRGLVKNGYMGIKINSY